MSSSSSSSSSSPPEKKKRADQLGVKWSELPRKDQLAVLCLLRFSEPVVRLSIISYVYYQLGALDPTLTSADIVRQASWLQTAFMLAQCASTLLLGRLADSPRGGRKLVALLSLAGSFATCAAFGFVRSFEQAVVLRVFEGLTNGNVAMVRTMVSEVVVEKRYQSTAFVLLPICTLSASIVAPLAAGFLAEAGLRAAADETSHAFLKSYPYALPALLNAVFLAFVFLVAFLFLEETLKPLQGRYDPGIALRQRMGRFFSCIGTSWRPRREEYTALEPGTPLEDSDSEEQEEAKAFLAKRESGEGQDSDEEDQQQLDEKKPEAAPFLPTSKMLTRNLLVVLILSVVQDMHISAVSIAMPNFLSAPVASLEDRQSWDLPLLFGGGCGFGPRAVSQWATIFGVVGVPMQLFVYPRAARHVRTVTLWRWAAWSFPLVWLLHPYVAVVPSTTAPPEAKAGAWVWLLLAFNQLTMAAAVTFTAPTLLLLVNLASPHPSALGRTHSINFFGTMAARALGTWGGGAALAWGSTHNMSSLVFWLCAGVAFVEIVLTPFVKEGDGHEIVLPGDDEAD